MKLSTRSYLLSLGQQVLASMAIGIVLFILIGEVARYSLSAEYAEALNSPLFMNILAIAAFPFVRKYMTTSNQKSD